jgi:hypothetical protein
MSVAPTPSLPTQDARTIVLNTEPPSPLRPIADP